MTQRLHAAPRSDSRPIPAADPAPAANGWDAALALSYERRGSRTVLVKNEHKGPLVVQKSLYPEGDGVCHTVILHPPGGIAGGDRLSIDIEAGRESGVLLTTPGATKWYKANFLHATQKIHLYAAKNSVVEWLPLETIVFDGADACSSLTVDMEDGACVAGWDMIAFGRSAAGERFTHGRFRQSIEIRRHGDLIWAEYGDMAGGDALLASPAGYAGRSVCGLLWVCGGAIGDAVLNACREAGAALPERMLAGVTFLPSGMLLARCLCDATEQARQYLGQVWQLLRPLYADRAATPPRLWAT